MPCTTLCKLHLLVSLASWITNFKVPEMLLHLDFRSVLIMIGIGRARCLQCLGNLIYLPIIYTQPSRRLSSFSLISFKWSSLSTMNVFWLLFIRMLNGNVLCELLFNLFHWNWIFTLVSSFLPKLWLSPMQDLLHLLWNMSRLCGRCPSIQDFWTGGSQCMRE